MTSEEPPAKRPSGLKKKQAVPEPEPEQEILYQCVEGADEITEYRSMWETAKKAFWREEKSEQVTMLLRAVIHEYDRMARASQSSTGIAEICGEALLLLAYYEKDDDIKHLDTILEICPDDSDICRLVREIRDDKGKRSPLACYHAIQLNMEGVPNYECKEIVNPSLPPLSVVVLAERFLDDFFNKADDDNLNVDLNILREYEQVVKHVCEVIIANEDNHLGSEWLHGCGDFYLLAGALYSCLDKEKEESDCYARTKHFYELIFQHHGEYVPKAIQEL